MSTGKPHQRIDTKRTKGGRVEEFQTVKDALHQGLAARGEK